MYLCSLFENLLVLNSYCIFLLYQAEEYGGPRKEFFLMMLKEIKIKYFDHGMRDDLEEDYYGVGLVFGNFKC